MSSFNHNISNSNNATKSKPSSSEHMTMLFGPLPRTDITSSKQEEEEEEEEEAPNKHRSGKQLEPFEEPVPSDVIGSDEFTAKVKDVDSFSKCVSMHSWFHNGSPSTKRKREVGVERVEEVKFLSVAPLNSFSKRVWRHRWLRNGLGITERKLKVGVDRRVEEEKDPSVGALALLGKALNGPGRCDVQKRRGCTVWK